MTIENKTQDKKDTTTPSIGQSLGKGLKAILRGGTAAFGSVAQVAGDTLETAANVIEELPDILEETVKSPLTAAVGYTAEDQQISREEAKKKVYAHFEEGVAKNIEKAALEFGAMLAVKEK